MIAPYRTSSRTVARRAPSTTFLRLARAWMRGTFRKLKKRVRPRAAVAQARQLVDHVLQLHPYADRHFVEALVRSVVVVREDAADRSVTLMNAYGTTYRFAEDGMRMFTPESADIVHRSTRFG